MWGEFLRTLHSIASSFYFYLRVFFRLRVGAWSPLLMDLRFSNTSVLAVYNNRSLIDTLLMLAPPTEVDAAADDDGSCT